MRDNRPGLGDRPLERGADQPSSWNSVIASFADPHLLQTSEWGQFKARYGWEPVNMLWPRPGDRGVLLDDPNRFSSSGYPPVAAALVLQRALPIRGFAAKLNVLYIPKGPLMRDWGDATSRSRLLDDLENLGRKRGAIFIKIDPDIYLGTGYQPSGEAQETGIGSVVIDDLKSRGWRFSAEQVQFRNTFLIDLTQSEESLLAHMKQKTRYNVGLAKRKGVTVRIGNLGDLSLLYRMYAETSVRDGFVIREEGYYQNLWQTFLGSDRNPGSGARPCAEALIAEVSGEPIAAVIVFYFAGKAWYLYGMSRETHREKMPNHLLQWEAIRRAKTAGCRVYDLWGAPDEFSEDDPLWGVYRFKEGLGGEVVRHLGAWDLPLRPLYYRLYTAILPRLLDLMRGRGKITTRQAIGI